MSHSNPDKTGGYDRGLIAIYDDFEVSPDNEWFIDKITIKRESTEISAHSAESFMWHAAQAQETVDDIIWKMMQ